MATIVQLQLSIAGLKSRELLELLIFTEIKKAEKEFIKAQKLQLNAGVNNEGKIIGTYSRKTAELSQGVATRKPKEEGEPYNFEYYGDFFDDMVLDVFADSASFYSEDSKTQELIGKYKNLFGLTKDNLEDLIKNIIAPQFYKEIRSVLKI